MHIASRSPAGPGFLALVGCPAAFVGEAQEDRFVAGFHMLDQGSGKAYSLIVLEDEASGARVAQALAQRPPERRVGVDPDQVQFLTAIAF